MYSTGPAPTDQRAGIRPIAFMLNNQRQFSQQVLLNVRPEDLTRNEPTRAAVHQTLGSGSAVGWVDNFGPGLPSVTINGHTGWRTAAGTGMDGAAAFEALHKLVEVDYFNAKQAAVDSGRDPSAVQLIFIDTLDKFTWAVVPTQFTLRRSKSRPLLFQYQINLQAVDVNVGSVPVSLPPTVNPSNAIIALDKSIAILSGTQPGLRGYLTSLFGSPAVADFLTTAVSVFNVARQAYAAYKAADGNIISMALQFSGAGANLINALVSTGLLPPAIAAGLMQVGAAFNEIRCIFTNALTAFSTYQNYTGLYGASNCSSTVGGRPASVYAGQNVFALTAAAQSPVGVTTQASAGLNSLNGMDQALSPVSMAEMLRNVGYVNSGVRLP